MMIVHPPSLLDLWYRQYLNIMKTLILAIPEHNDNINIWHWRHFYTEGFIRLGCRYRHFYTERFIRLGCKLFLLLYADDIVIFANTQLELQMSLNAVEDKFKRGKQLPLTREKTVSTLSGRKLCPHYQVFSSKQTRNWLQAIVHSEESYTAKRQLKTGQ